MNAAEKGESFRQGYDVDRGVEVGRFTTVMSAALLVGLVLAQIFVIAVGPPDGGFALAPPPSPLLQW